MNLQLDKGSYYGDLFLYIILSRGREFRRRDYAFRPAKSLTLSRLKTSFSSAFAYPRLSKSAKIVVESAKPKGEGLLGAVFL